MHFLKFNAVELAVSAERQRSCVVHDLYRLPLVDGHTLCADGTVFEGCPALSQR